MLVAVILVGHACARSGESIKIGYSMSLTGGLAPDGRSCAARAGNLRREISAKEKWLVDREAHLLR
jgi:hypothetical protein